MKLYILPVNKLLQPNSQPFRYPKHNQDYGVEQDFHRYILAHAELITADPAAADWHYLPVYWTRWHLKHDYGKNGLDQLQQEVERTILDDSKTFTICQYDDGPLANLGAAVVFLASRKSEAGLDIPLLCSAHQRPLFKPGKKYLASFMGRLKTHPIRQEMAALLQGRPDVFIYDGIKGSGSFVRTTLASYMALCPRGYGGSSFRFFEAMQLGVAPCLVGDLDTRPFRQFIRWDNLSLFAPSMPELEQILTTSRPADLVTMGQRAAEFWQAELTYQQWCKYVLMELEV